MVRVITIDKQGFLYVVSRNEWFAREPTQVSPVTRPFVRIHISLTRTAECNNRVECVDRLKSIQDQHMAEGSSDIRPSFLIGGYGTVYEGRGWGSQSEQIPNNRGNLEIAFIGNFATNSPILRPPPYEMFASALSLIKYGLKNEFIRQDYRLSYHFAHLQSNMSAKEVPMY